MNVEEYIKKYYVKNSKKSHIDVVKNFALKILKEIIKNEDFLYLNEYKYLLESASLLHDILSGTEGNHAKAGAKLILENKIEGYNDTEINIISCLIKYHNGKKPKKKHKIYGSLEKGVRKIIKGLTAILQLADLLDYFHLSYVEFLEINYDIKNSIFYVETKPNISKLKDFNLEKIKKTALFEKFFKVELNIL